MRVQLHLLDRRVLIPIAPRLALNPSSDIIVGDDPTSASVVLRVKDQIHLKWANEGRVLEHYDLASY